MGQGIEIPVIIFDPVFNGLWETVLSSGSDISLHELTFVDMSICLMINISLISLRGELFGYILHLTDMLGVTDYDNLELCMGVFINAIHMILERILLLYPHGFPMSNHNSCLKISQWYSPQTSSPSISKPYCLSQTPKY